MSHFKPVFRHFFFEKFPSPSQWFERRLAYTRSVATSSIGNELVSITGKEAFAFEPMNSLVVASTVWQSLLFL